MTVVPQILEVIQPVVRESGLDVGAVRIREDTAYGLVVRFSGRSIKGGVSAVGEEGERRLGSHRRHLSKSKALSMGDIRRRALAAGVTEEQNRLRALLR
jgi:hypothetical protein